MKNHNRPAVTVTEAADMLGISRALAYQLVARGDIPALRLGRRLVVPRKAIEAMLDEGVDGAWTAALRADRATTHAPTPIRSLLVQKAPDEIGS